MSDYALEAYIDSLYDVQRKMGGEANIPCPNPQHEGGFNACWVNMETGAGICFSCRYSFSLAKNSGIDENQIIHRQLLNEINSKLEDNEEHEVSQDNSVLARYAVRNHKYWQQRRIDSDTQELFELGYDAISDAVTIPLRNMRGGLIGVSRRFLDPDHLGSRYKYPKGFIASQNVFGSHLYGEFDMSTVYITEGAIDTMRIWQVMGPSIAIYGSSISKGQIDIMKRIGVQKVIWFGDSDDAGTKAKQRAAGYWEQGDGYKYKKETDLTQHFWFMHVTDHQGKKDAGEMTDREIIKACQSADIYRVNLRENKQKSVTPVRYLLERSRYNGKRATN